MRLAPPSRPRAVGLAAVIALLSAAEARATCMERVQIRPILPDCTVLKEPQGTGPQPPTIEIWPASQPLMVSAEVGGCCSPPGGPVSCSYRPVEAADAANFSLIAWDSQGSTQPVEGAFKAERLACLGQTVLVFARPVPQGTYVVQAQHGGGTRVQIADDERAARATRVSGLPAAQSQPTGEVASDATPTDDADPTGGASATPSPPGCVLGGASGSSVLVVLALLVRRRRK